VRPPFRRSLKPIALACALAGAVPAHAASQVVQVNASVVKPLALDWVQNLDLGTITLGPGTWNNVTIAVSQAGVLTCNSVNVTCTGATQAATYNVSGNKSQAVQISCPNVTLVNQGDPTKSLVLVTNAPASLVLANSGKPGTNFSIGGSITLNSNTAGGVYAGTFNVTVDY
jgi:hypothetical protein